MKHEIFKKAMNGNFDSYSKKQAAFVAALTTEEKAFLKSADEAFRVDVKSMLLDCVMDDSEFHGHIMGDSHAVVAFG